ncbi:DUF1254 domain-containing protein [Variovorax dokdonensis]|uniref:DUF1254 domain-containing protein n=1 Tax=Variovorax dokdonensis TaxID=344883 RepID=A0ABT7NGP1_9BURK|nr:DUF1254 domain-containing protein [Variovorax dokdonensis]MDM0047099.1 DUF1254 domain-containing protein [Variovorax dokdonensis]
MTHDELMNEARDAVIFTLPLFETARMRAATAPRRHGALGEAGDTPGSTMRWVNHMTHTQRLLGPEDRHVVSPNNDTLYNTTWLDLSRGPVLIEVPDMGERYWTLGFLDMWTNPFAYAGRRTTGNRAQRLFVHGPHWQGQRPDATVPIAVPGDDAWIIGRILVEDDAADMARVRGLQADHAILRADGSGQRAAHVFDTSLDGRVTAAPGAELYRRVVLAVLARNAAPAADADALASALSFLRPQSPEHHEAFAEALAEVHAQLRGAVQASDVGGGWSVPVLVRESFGQDYLTRARVARNLIGALGMEEAMYVMGEVDESGQALDGHHAYELRFGPGEAPQVDAFWSLTMYRRSDCMLVDNAIGRCSVGDRTRGLRYEADGSLCVRIQATDPGPAHNWLPAPAEPFYLALRLYQPREAHLQMRFAYPPLRRVD